MKTSFVLTFCIAAAVSSLSAQERTAWAQKPTTVPAYQSPMRPHTQLSSILAKHKGSTDWRQVIVDDDHLNAVYIAAAPGSKTPRSFHPDTRAWWVVMDGQIRFTIDGQEPFVASKGWMVQVPVRNIYSMETIGDKPSLRFEVNVAHAKTLYPKDEKPPSMPGFNWQMIKLSQPPGAYDHGNKPYIVFDEIAANLEKSPSHGGQYRFIQDDRGVGNIIYGYEKSLPAVKPGERGHYHPECAEFWIIMAGQISYKIEGQAPIVANVGDVVYAPKFTFHLARFYGPGPSCRLAMNGYPEISHLFDAAPVETSKASEPRP